MDKERMMRFKRDGKTLNLTKREKKNNDLKRITDKLKRKKTQKIMEKLEISFEI